MPIYRSIFVTPPFAIAKDGPPVHLIEPERPAPSALEHLEAPALEAAGRR